MNAGQGRNLPPAGGRGSRDTPAAALDLDARPSAFELWKQAGGGTDRYDRATYLRLMTEHGHLIPLKPGETREPLPCGWPDRRVGGPADG